MVVIIMLQTNRWKKRGLSLVPTRWGVNWAWAYYNVLVAIHSGDGTVSIAHGGIDMGQGINTKVQFKRWETIRPSAILISQTTHSFL